MENEEISKWKTHGKSALRNVKHGRPDALEEEGELCLAATAKAWQKQRAEEGKNFELSEFTQFLEKRLSEFEPALRQQRPNDPLPIPELPVDPVTGARAINPWAKETFDLESQKACMEKFPLLAEHLQKVAKGGYTFKLVAERLEEEARRAKMATINYGAIEHGMNPFRQSGDAASLNAQSRFQRDNPPEVVEFYKREAQPLRPFWSKGVRNMTKLSEVLGKDPNTGAVLRRAQAIEDGWIATELASAKEAQAAARANYERALRLSETAARQQTVKA
jgi:hypothetical protein